LFLNVYPRRSIAAGETTIYQADLFLGPKDLDMLSKIDRNLEYSIDLGNWIGFIARPMLHFMKWSFSWIGNFGWVIILLTILVRGLLYPLTHIQFRSMKRMQALKPLIEELRSKYKENKTDLNKHMVDLFRREKVNPMGSCFPLLLQMPVFFALYRVLYNAIELRHAPFLFWLQDLSAKDPFYVMPILLGFTMYLQQRMMPTAGMDPSQEQMMKMMPIMFSLVMFYLPSGLVVYIFLSTLLGILQQWLINRQGRAATNNKAA